MFTIILPEVVLVPDRKDKCRKQQVLLAPGQSCDFTRDKSWRQVLWGWSRETLVEITPSPIFGFLEGTLKLGRQLVLWPFRGS